MTTVANPTVGNIEDVIERMAYELRVQVGLPALYAAVPFLASWPFKPIIEYILGHYQDEIFAVIRQVVDLKVIQFVNAQNQKTFERQMVSLRAIARGYGIDSEQFKKGRADAKAVFSDFVRYHGA